MSPIVLADASVWIDYLAGAGSRQTDFLDRLVATPDLAIADLTLMEVLQGVRDQSQYERTRFKLSVVPLIVAGGGAVALQAARNYRALRARGITVRGTIDTLIATRCIVDGHALLFSDRDFEPFVAHLGLVDAMTFTS